MKLISKTAELNAAIAAQGVVSTATDANLHLLACSVFAHLSEHRDTTLVKSLFAALPKSAKRSALADWFTAFFPAVISAQGAVEKMAKQNSERWEIFTAELPRILNETQGAPFWEFKKEQAAKPVDFNTVMATIAKALKSDQLTSDSERDLIAALYTEGARMAARRLLADELQGQPVHGKGQDQETRPAVH